MRITSSVFPLAFLTLLPVYASFFGWRLIPVLVSLIFIFITRQVIIWQSLFQAKKHNDGKRHYVLETHAMSHYGEKVRWCLDYLKVNYTEEQDVASLGLLLLGRSGPTLKVPTHNIWISNSSDILRYLFGARYDLRNACDSQSMEILSKFLDPDPQSLELEKEFDMFGEYARRFAYGKLFQQLDSTHLLHRVLGLKQSKVPDWQKKIAHLMMPLIKFTIAKRNRMSVTGMEKAAKEISNTFKKVEEILSDGREFISGQSFPTYIDFHFCSMAAILIFPDNYGGTGIEPETRLRSSDLSSNSNEELQKFRQTPAGRFVMNMYKTHRHRKAF